MDIIVQGHKDCLTDFSRQETVHVAIDITTNASTGYMGRIPTVERREEYPRNVRKFADDLLAHNIRTIFVKLQGTLKKNQLLLNPSSARMVEFAKEGLLNREGEAVFIKNDADTFSRELSEHLYAVGTKNIILTGGNTRSCAGASMIGVLKSGFACNVAYDLLFDVTVGYDILTRMLYEKGGVEFKENIHYDRDWHQAIAQEWTKLDGSPEWHKQELENILAKAHNSLPRGYAINLQTADEILSTYTTEIGIAQVARRSGRKNPHLVQTVHL